MNHLTFQSRGDNAPSGKKIYYRGERQEQMKKVYDLSM